MEELTKQEEIEAIRQAQAEKLTPAQLKEELETEEALEELYQKAMQLVGNAFDIRKELEPFVRVKKTREKYNHVEVNLYVEIA